MKAKTREHKDTTSLIEELQVSTNENNMKLQCIQSALSVIVIQTWSHLTAPHSLLTVPVISQHSLRSTLFISSSDRKKNNNT